MPQVQNRAPAHEGPIHENLIIGPMRGAHDADAPVNPPPPVDPPPPQDGDANPGDPLDAAADQIRRAGEKYYFWHPDRSEWVTLSSDQIKVRLAVMGYRRRARGGGIAAVDQILDRVHMDHTCAAAVPIVYNQERTVILPSGANVVNTATRKPIMPYSEKRVQWGHHFPKIAAFLDGCWKDPSDIQKLIFLHWLHLFYRAAVLGQGLTRGQALFLLGGPGIGKGYLLNAILGPLLGGYELVDNIITGQDRFNRGMFASGLWVGHDINTADIREDDRIALAIKRLVANDTIVCRGMYSEQIVIPWLGRIVLSANEDPESLRVIPNMDLNNKDKFIVLHMTEVNDYEHASDEELLEELPHFGNWLMQMRWSKKIKRNARWGMEAYQAPSAILLRRQSSKHGEEEDLISELCLEILTDDMPGCTSGDKLSRDGMTSMDLLHELSARKSHVNTKGFSAILIGRILSRIEHDEAAPIIVESRVSRGRKVYMIRQRELIDE